MIRSASHLLWLTALAWISFDQAAGEAEAADFGYVFPVVEDWSGDCG